MNKDIFVTHPLYANHEYSSDGIVRDKVTKKNIGWINNTGYMMICIRFQGKSKIYCLHRFIWECFYGPIPKGLVVDHINQNRLDNRLENLRLVTQKENCRNSAPKIRLTYRRPVIGVFKESELKFPSINSAARYYDIKPASVKYVADGITNSAYSKNLKCRVLFVYQ